MIEKIENYFFDEEDIKLLKDNNDEFKLKFLFPVLIVSLLLNIILFFVIL